jgi:hypothetical protein
MRGTREFVTSVDHTSIGLLTAGSGPPLLLVHGGMSNATRWAPVWELLGEHRLVARWTDEGVAPVATGRRTRWRRSTTTSSPWPSTCWPEQAARWTSWAQLRSGLCPRRGRPRPALPACRPLRGTRAANRPAGMVEQGRCASRRGQRRRWSGLPRTIDGRTSWVVSETSGQMHRRRTPPLPRCAAPRAGAACSHAACSVGAERVAVADLPSRGGAAQGTAPAPAPVLLLALPCQRPRGTVVQWDWWAPGGSSG